MRWFDHSAANVLSAQLRMEARSSKASQALGRRGRLTLGWKTQIPGDVEKGKFSPASSIHAAAGLTCEGRAATQSGNHE